MNTDKQTPCKAFVLSVFIRVHLWPFISFFQRAVQPARSVLSGCERAGCDICSRQSTLALAQFVQAYVCNEDPHSSAQAAAVAGFPDRVSPGGWPGTGSQHDSLEYGLDGKS